MCEETSGPRGSSSHSGRFQSRSEAPVRDRVARVLEVHDPRRSPLGGGLREVGRRYREADVFAVLVDGPPERAAVLPFVGDRVVDVVVEDRSGEQRAVDAGDHLVDVVEGLLGAVRAEALAEQSSFGRVCAGISASRSWTAWIISRSGIGCLVDVDEERDPARQVGVLQPDERRVAVVHVLEWTRGLVRRPSPSRSS